MNLNIRPVDERDIDDIVELSLLAWEPVFQSFLQSVIPSDRNERSEWRESRNPCPQCQMASYGHCNA